MLYKSIPYKYANAHFKQYRWVLAGTDKGELIQGFPYRWDDAGTAGLHLANLPLYSRRSGDELEPGPAWWGFTGGWKNRLNLVKVSLSGDRFKQSCRLKPYGENKQGCEIGQRASVIPIRLDLRTLLPPVWFTRYFFCLVPWKPLRKPCFFIKGELFQGL